MRFLKSAATRIQFIKVNTFKDDNIHMLLNEMEAAIVVFNDLMNEMCSDETITNFFSRECHHKKLCIFHVWQNLYPQKKFAVTLNRNTQCKIVFENPEIRHQLKTMFVHMYPYDHKRIYQKVMDFFTLSLLQNSPLLCLEHHHMKKTGTVQLLVMP